MFFRKGNTGPLVRGRTPMERFLRTVGLFVVFLAVGLAFWHNNERRMREIAAGGALKDPAGLLSKEDRSFVTGFIDSIKDRFGVQARVEIGPAAADFTETDSKTLFFGIDPEARKVAAAFPPLMRRALGGELSAYLEREHFEPYWASGDWAQGLKTALALIWTRLDNLDQPGGGRSANDTAPAPEQEGSKP
ncbi:TPM domain-containing protein [Desulfovibrio aminophilus]|nr:TPM domain-containing protein [Desulfovibrio aminophilus]MCM0754629.1 TPM domain-containing protein [Desulfovibrio aminophilus]